jgi:hypothetical protein
MDSTRQTFSLTPDEITVLAGQFGKVGYQASLGCSQYSFDAQGFAQALFAELEQRRSAAAHPAFQSIAQRVIEYGDARVAGEGAAVQAAFRAVCDALVAAGLPDTSLDTNAGA